MGIFHTLIRVLFSVLVHVFFHDIEVVGDENIPDDGGLIFVGNHQNQFVDFLLLTVWSSRQVSFLVAAVSLKRIVIRVFAWLTNCIPVHRQRDTASQGTGLIKTGDQPNEIVGQGTKFKDTLEVGDTIYVLQKEPVRLNIEATIKEILSDDRLILSSAEATIPDFVSYKVSRKVEQGQIYDKVWETLGHGGCIGIFPEGCSHDIPELLPLKAGVAVMALGTVDKYNVPVKIVPCGLNYFSGHRFRGHVVIQYGKPIVISPGDEIVKRYKDPKQRRNVYTEILDSVAQSLRSVTLNTPTLEILRSVLLVRNLYQPKRVTPEEYLELNRGFAKAYIKLKDEPDVKAFSRDVSKYQKLLTAYGLKDYHVATGQREIGTVKFFAILVGRFLRLSLMILLALPGMIINLPIMLLARIYALKKSAISAQSDPNSMYGARDEMASNKIIVAAFGIPSMWAVYCLVPYFLGYNEFKWSLLCFCILPFLSYASLRLIEKGIWEWRLLRVVLTIQGSKDKLASLRVMRKDLQIAIRKLVKTFGPKLGEEWETKYKSMLRFSDRDGSKDWFEGLDDEEFEGQQEKLEWRTHSYKKPTKRKKSKEKGM